MYVRSVKTETQESIPAAIGETHYDHQNSVQEKGRPRNESPEDIIINRRATYKLRRIRRELSQSKLIS